MKDESRGEPETIGGVPRKLLEAAPLTCAICGRRIPRGFGLDRRPDDEYRLARNSPERRDRQGPPLQPGPHPAGTTCCSRHSIEFLAETGIPA